MIITNTRQFHTVIVQLLTVLYTCRLPIEQSKNVECRVDVKFSPALKFIFLLFVWIIPFLLALTKARASVRKSAMNPWYLEIQVLANCSLKQNNQPVS